jgi:hypothetical protein
LQKKYRPQAIPALMWRKSLALQHAGAVAFPGAGDPSIGDFQDAVITREIRGG